MVSMKRTKAEQKDDNDISMGSSPYPWGLQISLDEAALKKLGFKELPDAGELCQITAVGKVTSVSSTAQEKNPVRRMEIQITDLNVACEDEDEDAERFTKGYKKGMGR